MFTTVGYYESIDGAAVWHNIAAIPDQHVTVNGDYVYIPKSMPNVIGKAVLSGADTSLLGGRLDAPSLRRVIFPNIEPLVNAVVFGSPPEATMHAQNPTPLIADEGLSLQILSDATVAKLEYGLVWLSDGNQPVAQGQMYTARATSAVTLAAGTWVNGALAFDQTLPVGEYDIVGMRARGANLIAARLVFVDSFNRPGVPAVNAVGDNDITSMRYGRMGVFGRFHSSTPPTVDCLGVSDTAQVFLFDLIKVS